MRNNNKSQKLSLGWKWNIIQIGVVLEWNGLGQMNGYLIFFYVWNEFCPPIFVLFCSYWSKSALITSIQICLACGFFAPFVYKLLCQCNQIIKRREMVLWQQVSEIESFAKVNSSRDRRTNGQTMRNCAHHTGYTNKTQKNTIQNKVRNATSIRDQQSL